MLITFEGLDFCGKSTQVKLLEKYLTDAGKKVKIIREPGGTEISEKIRTLLLDKKHSGMTMNTELLLFSASRSQLVSEVIKPLLDEGYYVISDRYHDSSVAYQGYGRGVPLDFVTALQNFAIDGAVPDITFIIDIPVEESVRRKSLVKKSELDRIELSHNDFYERVRNGYFELSKKQKRFKIIDDMQDIQVIHDKIIKEISNHS